MRRIILFNGPPRCGKDTAARFCFLNPQVAPSFFTVFDRMSMPIKKAFAAATNLNIDWQGNVEHWEKQKEEIILGFGVSYRQWQIDFSEKFMKPLYGEDIFGKLFIARQRRQHRDAITLVPDCGFNVEYKTLAAEYGEENILVIKIWRDGTTFAGDSRGYLKVGSIMDWVGLNDIIHKNILHLSNNGTREEFELKVLTRVKEWLNAKA
jgi:hypothetical protein